VKFFSPGTETKTQLGRKKVSFYSNLQYCDYTIILSLNHLPAYIKVVMVSANIHRCPVS